VTDTSFDGGRLRITQLDGADGFRIEGDVDLSNRTELAAALAASMYCCGDFVVDLSGCIFIDVEGMRMLVRAARAMTGGRVLVLRRIPPVAQRLLEAMNWKETPGLLIEREQGRGTLT
jgi:anti-anti-sigma regulatory factor